VNHRFVSNDNFSPLLKMKPILYLTSLLKFLHYWLRCNASFRSSNMGIH